SASSGSVFNAGYYLHGNQTAQTIGFIPIPTQADTTGKSISVWGIVMPADLVNNTDPVVIPYPDNFSQLIELRAAQILMSKGQENETAAQRYLAEFNLGVTNMQTFIKERQADGVQMVVDVEIDNIDFQT